MIDYFSLFGINSNFFIDKTFLRKKYLELIKNFQQNNKIIQLSEIHTAYKTLNDDELRIEYFLKLWGLIKPDGSSDFKLSNEFLMEMMEFNEKILSGDEQNHLEIQKLLEGNLQTIFQLFEKELTDEIKNQIAEKFFERKYFKRLVQRNE